MASEVVMANFFDYKAELDKLMRQKRSDAIEATRTSIALKAEICRHHGNPIPSDVERDRQLTCFVEAYDLLSVCTKAYARSNYKTARKLAQKMGTPIDHEALLMQALDQAHGPAADHVAKTMRRCDILRATLP